jgi:hypothetical protein
MFLKSALEMEKLTLPDLCHLGLLFKKIFYLSISPKNSRMLKLKWILLTSLLALISLAQAMPGPGTGPPGPPIGPPCWAPPCVPIDGAISLLLVGGVAFGINFLVKKK